MSPDSRLRHRVSTVLNMVMAFVVMILLAQLWLFTVVLESAEITGKFSVGIPAVICSVSGCSAVWILIRYFTKVEKNL